jgi:hypothetical protein
MVCSRWSRIFVKNFTIFEGGRAAGPPANTSYRSAGMVCSRWSRIFVKNFTNFEGGSGDAEVEVEALEEWRVLPVPGWIVNRGEVSELCGLCGHFLALLGRRRRVSATVWASGSGKLNDPRDQWPRTSIQISVWMSDVFGQCRKAAGGEWSRGTTQRSESRGHG